MQFNSVEFQTQFGRYQARGRMRLLVARLNKMGAPSMSILSVGFLCLLLGGLPISAHDGHDSHKVVLILFDGFRWDYLKIKGLEGFSQFMQDGAWVEKMTMAFPALSYPQYYTIMTGLYAENHGMVGNDFYDPLHEEPWLFANNPEYNHTHFYDDGEPMWVTATKQDKKSALYYWPACEISIRNVTPAFCDEYWYWPNQTFIHSALERTLDNLEQGFDFVGIYVEETDKIGHKYGTFSKELNETVLNYDKEMKNFLDGLKARNLFDETNVILVSDHGMTNYVDQPYVQPLANFTEEEYNQTILWHLDYGIYPTHPKYTKMIYEKVKSVNDPRLHVFLKEDFPDRYHYKHDRRIAPILMYVDTGYQITWNLTLTTKNRTGNKASHGYLPETSDMKGLFLGIGPDFIKGSRQANIDSVDVYRLMCKMLGITPAPNNGTWSHVTGITRFKDLGSSSKSAYTCRLLDLMYLVVTCLLVNHLL